MTMNKRKQVAVVQKMVEGFPIASEPSIDDCCDNYGIRASIQGSKTTLDIELQIWDSGDADDGIYGKHGNFHFSIVESGGRIVASYS